MTCNLEEALATHLLFETYPKKWQAPKLPTYFGTSDPEDHLRNFRIGMEDMIDQRDIWCQMFHHALSDDVVGWYHSLLLGSVHTFKELERVFKVASKHRTREKGTPTTLLNVFHGKRKRLREYMDSTIITALRSG